MATPNSTIANREGKYLTFSLASEEYGIEIHKIREIIGLQPITTIPQTPPHVKGVINLRGKVIPVVALRLRFGMSEIAYTDRSCIIVVDVSTDAGNGLIGIMVDTVSEVMNMRGEDIEDPPAFGASVATDFILGMAKSGSGVKMLLDIDKVMSAEDMVEIQQAAA